MRQMGKVLQIHFLIRLKQKARNKMKQTKI